MPVALATIEKTLNGRTWRNTWGIAFGNLVGHITNTATLDVARIFMTVNPGNVDTDINVATNPNSESFTGANSVLASILGFERLMHPDTVFFTRMYISDGKSKAGQAGPSNRVFVSIPLAFTGLGPTLAGGPAPASIALRVNREPTTGGFRNGMLQMRAVVARNNIAFGPEDGVTFVDLPALLGAVSQVNNAVVQSNLDGWINGGKIGDPAGEFDEAAVVIPIYQNKYEPLPGSIKAGAHIKQLKVVDLMARQVSQKKRKNGT